MTDTTAGEGVTDALKLRALHILQEEVEGFDEFSAGKKTDIHKVLCKALAAQPSAGAQALDFERDGDKIILPKIATAELCARMGWAAGYESATLGAGGKCFDDAFKDMEIAHILATTTQPDTGDVAALREVAEHAATVMRYLEEDGASIVAHLMDTDDNPGQRLREALAALSKPSEDWRESADANRPRR